jgi:Response regulators consisting of a CheY-like receiver domain and a winged-helix DNA-binding domain
LVIDDEKVLAELLSSKIEQAGFSAIVAHDGEEGLQKALAERPSLILLDIVMPKMDGIKVLKKLARGSVGQDRAGDHSYQFEHRRNGGKITGQRRL